MSIKPEYVALLDHLQQTVTISELHAQPDAADLIALRHDVDHDLDLALEMAHVEHARGIRATYYLLPTAPYWDIDPQFDTKVRQLAAYGHEVALHLNLLTQWHAGAIDDVAQALRDQLARLRDCGVEVTSVSGHGDKCCYRENFSNNWLFAEERPADPAASERGKSAEGIVVADADWQLTYPADGELRRSSGEAFSFWSLRMADFGVTNNAVNVPHDHYWTDSGGSFSRSSDPLAHDLSRRRHQVLIHPIWWRGPKRSIFVLSAARSGSTWLAGVIDHATPATAVHEWSLNHRYDGDEIIADKRTADDYQGLIDAPNVAAALLRHTKRHATLLPGDRVECNVYLEPFVDEIRAIVPEAESVHLHRDAPSVVRSILNRNWYDTPLDRRHRSAEVDTWAGADQFERACHYWAFTNAQIGAATDTRIDFNQVTASRDGLAETLQSIGLPVHPLLLDEIFNEPVNVNAAAQIPPAEDWPDEARATLAAICGEQATRLGHPTLDLDDDCSAHVPRRAGASDAAVVHEITPGAADMAQVHATVDPGGEIRTIALGHANAHVMLTPGAWSKAPRNAIAIGPDRYIAGVLYAACTSPGPRLFILGYDRGRAKIAQKAVVTLRGDDRDAPARHFTYRPPPDAAYIGVALHLGDRDPNDTVRLDRLTITIHSLADYRLAADRLGVHVQSRSAGPV